jgi:hypothetical protein
MLKIKVTEKSGASIEYEGEEELLSRLTEIGHGQPERWVLHKDELGAPLYDDIDVLKEEIKEGKKWVKLKAEYTVEVTDCTHDFELRVCLANRRKEYPTPEDFLNAYFDGGEVKLEELRLLRLAVKAKYPKP